MERAQWENTSYGKIKNYASFCCHIPSKHTLGTDEDSHGSTYRTSKRVSEWWIWDALSNVVFRLYIIYIIMSRSLIIKHLLYILKSSRHVVSLYKRLKFSSLVNFHCFLMRVKRRCSHTHWDTLFWLWASQSLLLFLNAECLAMNICLFVGLPKQLSTPFTYHTHSWTR